MTLVTSWLVLMLVLATEAPKTLAETKVRPIYDEMRLVVRISAPAGSIRSVAGKNPVAPVLDTLRVSATEVPGKPLVGSAVNVHEGVWAAHTIAKV